MKPNTSTGLCRYHRAALCCLLAIILICLSFWALNYHEPVYHQKILSTWVRQLSEGGTDERVVAAAAIRAMGNQVVPALITSLAQRDGRLRNARISFTSHFLSLRDRYISVEVERGYAASALGAIGPAAKEAIPALIAASMEANSFCAARAKAALIQIGQGPTESLALPPSEIRSLTNWLQRAEILLSLGSNIQASANDMVAVIGEDSAQRFEIVEALGCNKSEPNASVLLLRGLLKDKERAIRKNVLNMLMLQRVFAKAAYQEIALCTNDLDAGVRANAAFALMFEFPKQASAASASKDAEKTKPSPVEPK